MTKQNSMLVVSMIDSLTHVGNLYNKGDIFPLKGHLYEELKDVPDEKWDEEMKARFRKGVIFCRPTVEELIKFCKEANVPPQNIPDPKQRAEVARRIEADQKKKLEDAKKLREEAEEEEEKSE